MLAGLKPNRSFGSRLPVKPPDTSDILLKPTTCPASGHPGAPASAGAPITPPSIDAAAKIILPSMVLSLLRT